MARYYSQLSRPPKEVSLIWTQLDKQKRYVRPKFRSVKGFDIETLPDGYPYLITCHTVRKSGRNDDEFLFAHDSYELFEFLLKHGANSVYWGYNISFDMSGCLKQHLAEYERVNGKSKTRAYYNK